MSQLYRDLYIGEIIFFSFSTSKCVESNCAITNVQNVSFRSFQCPAVSRFGYVVMSVKYRFIKRMNTRGRIISYVFLY